MGISAANMTLNNFTLNEGLLTYNKKDVSNLMKNTP